eukprot:m.692617 g.692617  ORF g.692617 m.692617 type:complete len:989 (+) comp22866_c0_seq1:172-3138(+)
MTDEVAAKDATASTGISTSSLFVRNLSYDTTSEQLETLLSDIGPIKQCFVVTEAKSTKSRGYGIVHFADAADAAEALTKFNGRAVNGRELRIEYAKKRASQKERRGQRPATSVETDESREKTSTEEVVSDAPAVQTEVEAAPETATQKSEKSHVPKPSIVDSLLGKNKPKSLRADSGLESRTIVVTNAPASFPLKKLRIKCRKFGAIENTGDGTVKTSAEGDGKYNVEIVFAKHKDARTAVAKLPTLLGTGRVHLKTRVTTTVEGAIVPKEKPKHGDKLKRYRIIIRNLPFSCTEAALRSACAKFGPLTEVKLVTDKDTKKFRGFAFVQYKSPTDAAKAIPKLNGKDLMGRKITVDWTVAKTVYDTIKSGAMPAAAGGAQRNADGAGSDSESSGSSSDGESSDEADSQTDAVAGTAKSKAATASSSDAEEAASDSDGDTSAESEEESGDDSAAESGDDSAAESGDEEEFEKSSDVRHGCTVFVRNVSFDTTEEVLKDTFAAFGDVVMCKVVEDIGTGRSRGMAFVKFAQREQADKCVLRASDASVAALGPIECDGRPLRVAIAVDRKEAADIANRNADEREAEKLKEKKKDARNLYLLQEGIIINSHPDYARMSTHDQRLRQRLEMESKSKVKNPNLSVSSTRLSVHNMPLEVDEATLRKLVLGVFARKKSVVAAEPTPDAMQPLHGKLLQVKVVRSKDRVGTNGKLRSKGFGFLEFSEHSDALYAVRRLNNNPNLFASTKRPIVQFAWVDATVIRNIVRRREQSKIRLERLQRASAEEKRAGSVAAKARGLKKTADKQEHVADKKLGRGALQRKRKREMKNADGDVGASSTNTGSASVITISRSAKKKQQQRSSVASVPALATSGVSDDVKAKRRKTQAPPQKKPAGRKSAPGGPDGRGTVGLLTSLGVADGADAGGKSRKQRSRKVQYDKQKSADTAFESLVQKYKSSFLDKAVAEPVSGKKKKSKEDKAAKPGSDLAVRAARWFA